MFALIGVAFVVFQGVLESALSVIPDVFALGISYLAVKGPSPRMAWLRFTAWRLQRKVLARGKHLRLVDDGRNMPRDSDRFIH
jgi:hypothetical protein